MKLTIGKALLYHQGGSQPILVCLTSVFFLFWDRVFCAFWQLGLVYLVIWEQEFNSFQCSHHVGIVTVHCLPLFQVFYFSKIDWFSDVRGEISVLEKGRSCAIQSKTWSPIVAAGSSIVQTSRCVI